MRILDKIDKLTDKLSQLPLPPDIVKQYNDVVRDINYYFELQKTNDVAIDDEQIKELWLEFEKQRFEITGKRYSSKARQIAINKIYQLADYNWEKFKNLIEWAIALGYPDISPKILDFVEAKQQGKLFKESVYSNFIEFMWFFRHKQYYNTINFRHYYERIYSWSESKNIRKKHWGFASLIIVEKDLSENKLVTITPEQRKKETIDGDRLNELWKKVISEANLIDELKTDILKNAHPEKLFRLRLQINSDSKTADKIEKHILAIKPTFYKYNIREIIYKLSK